MRWLLLLFWVSAALAGCAQPQTPSAPPSAPALAAGAAAPDIAYTTLTGAPATLSRQRQPLAILGFVDPPGRACCQLDPQLVELHRQFAGRSLSVIQVTEPTASCRHGAGCFEGCRLPPGTLTALCDRSRQAWSDFLQPPPGSVFLLDGSNRVVQVANLKDPASVQDLARTAERLASGAQATASRVP